MNSDGSSTDHPTLPSSPEPIAIVGIGCRWPGGVRSPAQLWNLLKEERDGYSDFTEDRINLQGFYHPDGRRLGSMYTKGGFLLNENTRDFDHTFFGMSATETMSLDPSQRKLLEVTYEAIENAGIPLEQFSGSKTGVFVGNFNNEHQTMQYRDTDHTLPYVVTGGGPTILSNRISYVFDLKGPSLMVDTASADGYARAEGFGAFYLKKLSDALADGDSIRALIRGTAFNANGKTGGISHPSSDGQEAVIRQAYRNAGNLNPDVTGYAECHGTGTPVGDPIEVSAIGRVFHEGRTQEPLLVGSIKPNLGHSEAASAMSQLMKCTLAMEHGEIPATIGIENFNPNVDFTGAKVKVVTKMTPWPSHLLRRSSINRISIPRGLPNANGFTMGLSNGHINGHNDHDNGELPSLSWCSPVRTIQVKQAGARPFVLLPFSAHDDRALKSIASNISSSLRDFDLADVLYTLSRRRSNFPRRAFAIAESGKLSEGLNPDNLIPGKAPSTPATRIGFVFTGQGAQWPQMGCALLAEYAVFRHTIKYLDSVLSRLRWKPAWTIEGALKEPPATSKINDPAFSQTVCTGLQIALVALLRQWEINPTATVGHSSGEIAAAYAAGRLKASEAIVLAYFRGQVVTNNQNEGLMSAVGLGPHEARNSLNGFEDEVKIAAVNSPNSVTLSGEPEPVKFLSQKLTDQGVFARTLKTGGNAYHSHHMWALGTSYEDQATEGLREVDAVTDAEPPVPVVKWVSSVTLETQIDTPRPDYWRRNLESPVLFAPAVEVLAKEEPLDLLVEIGPHPALTGPLKQIRTGLEESDKGLPPVLATLRRGEHDVVSMLSLAGHLFLNNAPVDLAYVNATETKTESDSYGPITLHHGFQCVDLFPYPYSYPEAPVYFENRFNREYRTRRHARHDLLGLRTPAGSKKHPQWRNVLRLKDLPWLDDHKLLPHPVLPGAAYITMAVEAVAQLHDDETEHAGAHSKIRSFKLRQVVLNSTLNIEDTELGTEIIVNVQKVALTNASLMSQWYSFSIGSIAPNNDTWTEHCTGMVCAMTTDNSIDEGQNLELDPRSRSLDMTRWHRKFASLGLGYGPAFQGLSDLQAYWGSNIAGATVALKPTGDDAAESHYLVHPATLDTCIQLALIACHAGQVERLEKAFVPVFIDEVTIWNPNDDGESQAWGIASGSPVGLRSISARVQLHGCTSNRLLLEIGEVKCVTYDGGQGDADSMIAREPYWRPVTRIDVDSMTTGTARALFPPETLSSNTPATLDTLAAHVIASIGEELSSEETSPSEIQTHNKFGQWITAWLSSSAPKDVLNDASRSQRRIIIEKLAEELCDVPEAKCLKTLHDNIDKVLRGDTNSFKLLMESNALTELYKSGLFVQKAHFQLQQLVDLLAHKNPRMRILEVGAGLGGTTAAVLETLSANSLAKRFEQYVITDSAGWCVSDAKTSLSEHGAGLVFQTLDVQEDPVSQGLEYHSFDLIIAAGCLIELSDPIKGLEHLHSLLKPSGSLVVMETTHSALAPELLCRTLTGRWDQETFFLDTAQWNTVLQKSGFSGVDVSLPDARRLEAPAIATRRPPEVYIVFRDNHPPLLAESITAKLRKEGQYAMLTDLLLSHEIPSNSLVISMVDVNGSTMTCRDDNHFKALQGLLLQASGVVWVASDLRSPADSAIMKGLLRSIAVENVLSKYCFVEIDQNHFTSQARAAELILARLDDLQASVASGVALEAESVLRDGSFYVERLLPEESLNEEFRLRYRHEDVVQESTVGGQGPFMACYGQPGVLSSLYFRSDPEFDEALDDSCIDIKTEAIGLNMKVGPAVKSLQVGDRVFGMIPGNMGNFLRSPASLVAKIPARLSAEEAASMPVVYLTAIYALSHLAHLGKGDSVLIQSATGGLGMAALQLSQHLGAEVFATVGNDDKREILIEEFGIPASHIFNSRKLDAVDDIMKMTKRKGVDVILSAAGGDLMHEMWRCIAPLGRFIDVGRTDVLGGGRLGLEVFKRNATFSSFDMGLIYRQKPFLIERLMTEMNKLIRQGSINPIKHLTCFDISRLESAMSSFSKGQHTGKFVITFKEPNATLKVLRPASRASFDPNAAYLLVGCLGGLGRSLAAWMVERGARQLVFLSRSGTTARAAGSMSTELIEMGANPQIVQCDVTDQKALRLAVGQIVDKLPVKGIVHAAMVEGDAFFNNTTLSQIQDVLAPKVTGTVNLHEATKHLPLDFFLMTSSIIGSVGTASQGAYTAANAFQDAFARFRVSQSLPATSLGLGLILEVGSVSNAVGFQQMLERSATYGISETEFLQLVEGALCESNPSRQTSMLSKLDPDSLGQVVTGLEPARFIPKIESDRAGDLIWFNNTRFQAVTQAVLERARARNSAGHTSGGAASYRSRIDEAPTPEGKTSIAQEALGARIGELVSVAADDLDFDKAPSHYGVDSLVAGELRNWLIRTFGVDVSLLHLLDQGTKLDSLVKEAAGIDSKA
ncbi:MAG: hypothetical protein Q9159_004980 [Coniocarpon cinnabarinum]